MNDRESIACFLLLLVLLLGHARGNPLGERAGVVSELSQRLASHARAAAVGPEPRLPPLPSPQDLAAIKKVAQILIMLGEQVIPTIIGESGGGTSSHSVPPGCDPPPSSSAVEDIPNDPVNGN